MSLHHNTIDLTGRRFGRLVVICLGARRPVLWSCVCDCGSSVVVRSSPLRDGRTKSCGCYMRDRASEVHQSHGMTNSAEYRIWSLMKDRCLNVDGKAYPEWGGRGIALCDAWHDFEGFYADMGPRPSPEHQLDRKDNDGPYSPDNCRWATRIEQANNKRNNVILEVRGVAQSVARWAAQVGVSEFMIHKRLWRGWEAEEAIFTPSRAQRKWRRRPT